MVQKILVIAFLFASLYSCDSLKYDNYILYQVLPTQNHHITFLKNLDEKKFLKVIFWKRPYKIYHELQFIAPANESHYLSERFEHYALPFEILETNVQKLFDKQTIHKYTRTKFHTFSWKHYYSGEDIYKWLQDISLKYASNVKLETIGFSALKREIYAVSIRSDKNIQKPKVIIEAGSHGHEWIAPMFATYVIQQLIHAKSDSNSKVTQLAHDYDWYIVPLLNPDGYEYSQTEDRMWRKNRRYTDRNCTGVDLDKNFDYSFGGYDSSTNPESDFYCGTAPLSEPESAALAHFITKINNPRAFFSIHSYGQMFILPYSDYHVERLGNYYEIENYAKQAIYKIFRTTGSKYQVGTYYDMVGSRGSGDPVTWVKDMYHTRYCAAIVLRDTGATGFALPPEQIEPACNEAWVGLVEMMTVTPKVIRGSLFSANTAATAFQSFWSLLYMFFILIWN